MPPAKAAEAPETTTADAPENHDHASESESESEQAPVDAGAPSSSTADAKKKKKKKKSKAARVASALLNKDKDKQATDAVVQTVLEKFKEQHPENPEVNEADVRKAMDMMKLMDYVKGNSALGGQKQEAGDHKV